MIRHPAPEALLFDYASGALPEALTLAVAVHLALCAESRATVAAFERLGGDLLDAEIPVDLAPGALNQTLARLSAPMKIGGMPDITLMKNSAFVASPRMQEELAAFPHVRTSGPSESFQVAPLK